MQFQVPQFLDVEDKVVGPLTIKQFLYSAGGMGMGYMVFKLIPWTIIALIPAMAFAALGFALAFWKFNNKPFIEIIEAAFYFMVGDRLYVWKQQHKQAITEEEIDLTRFKNTRHVRSNTPSASTGSKLGNLSWQIDLQPEVVASKVNPHDA
jgi:hypothetical protein